MDIEFTGFTHEEKSPVASTEYPFEFVFDNLSRVSCIADPEQWCEVLRTDKAWRILWPTDCGCPDRSAILEDGHLLQCLHHRHDKDGEYNVWHCCISDVQRRRHRDFMEKAADPAKAKTKTQAFIMKPAMIDCMRENCAVGAVEPVSKKG